MKSLASGLVLLSLAGCTTPYGEPNYTGTGALAGGVGGAGLGALIAHGHPGAGALIGGAAGALTGGIIGSSMDQQARYVSPPVYVAPAPAPPPGYVWVEGQYVWDGRAWIWAPGHWLAIPPAR